MIVCVCLCPRTFSPNNKQCIRQPISVPIFGVCGHTHTHVMKYEASISLLSQKDINPLACSFGHGHTHTGLSLHAVKLFQLYYPSDVLLSVVCSNAWGGEDRQGVCVYEMQSEIWCVFLGTDSWRKWAEVVLLHLYYLGSFLSTCNTDITNTCVPVFSHRRKFDL